MTVDFSNSPQQAQEQFDTGPLSWVMAEVREAVTHAGKMLTQALTQDADSRSTSLLHAKSYLHQAHGALQIVDIDGVSMVTETIEDVIDRLQMEQLEMRAEHVEVILDAFHAVLRYLEDLLSGAAHQPVRLFPYYRALLELKGADRIHPADLFFPALSMREKIPELTVTLQSAPADYTGLRGRFEKALLTLLTSKELAQQQEAAAAIRIVLKEIEQMQSNPQAKAFWVVMSAFAEAVAQGGIENQQYVKQIFGRINLQIRRLLDGVQAIPERLLRDALFFLAQVSEPSPFVASIRQAYSLANQVPLDYNQKNYGQIAAGVLSTAKEQLTTVKNLWGRIANGETTLADKFSQKMKDLAETSGQLNAPALAKLLRELSGIARHVAHTAESSKLGLELATSLLFIETALDQITRLPAHFSERADEITARLLSVVSGDEPASQAPWMGEISREAQQRQTMGVLVGEMQTSLRQVEKILDDYFRDTSQTATLSSVDSILHQVGGALAMLDQDVAMQAVEHTRQLIAGLAAAAPEERAGQAQTHQTVAQNIGALSFFIETLQSQPETAKKKFSFDTEAGVFRSNLLEAVANKALLPANGLELTTALPAAATAEQELTQQQQESARLAVSLAAHPDDQSLHTQLIDSLESERAVAHVLDDADASERAATAIDLLGQAGQPHSAADLQDIVTATIANPESQPLLAVVLPNSEAAVDAELLDIFLTEAEEVLEFVELTLPSARKDIDNQAYLTSLRRSFHTLKGSSRMVGLPVFGAAAWSVEQVMNLWLSESRSGSDALYTLLEHSALEMTRWVAELKQSAYSSRDGAALIAAAERLQAGLPAEHSEIAELAEIAEITPVAEALPAVAAIEEPTVAKADDLDELLLLDLPVPAEADADADDFEALLASDVAQQTASATLAALAEPQSELTPIPEPLLDLSPTPSLEDWLASSLVTELEPAMASELAAASVAEADLADEFIGAETVNQPAVAAEAEIEAAVAEAAVAEETVEAAPLESVLPESIAASSSAQIIGFPEQSRAAVGLDDNIKRIGELEISLPLYSIYMAETDEIVRFLSQDFAEWRHEPYRHVTTHAIHASHTLAGSSATVGLKPLQELAHSLEMVLQRLERHPVELLVSEYDLLELALDTARNMLQKFALSEIAEFASERVHQLEILLADVIARSAAGADEEFITSTNEKLDLADLAGVAGAAELVAALPEGRHAAAFDAPASTAQLTDSALQIKDDLDLDLLPVFIEEGLDLLPMIEQLLRRSQEQPDDAATLQAIARLMHTMKGSARMAGAMALGQHIHDMETRIENLMLVPAPARGPLLEDLLTRHDLSMQLFDRLQHPEVYADDGLPEVLTAAQELDQFQEAQVAAVSEPVAVPTSLPSGVVQPFATPLHAVAARAAAAPAAPVTLVRVRADVLDRLVNQAGEVSISRSRLENEVGTLRSSLSELTENVSRLRAQLREVEIQAETQITSRMAHSADREFDPLEFDRFTRLQELTRMMAESVSDVATVQTNLTRTIDGASGNLHVQARLTRELQQDLMRVRMIPFASVTERLYRVTRQTAKEIDKRVNLDIRGGNVEMDRGVLEKMVGPFEHLLRNAIVHGIESRQVRRDHGKDETGELQIEVRQEGNEVVIRFKDDGQGLNLDDIRDKAHKLGLLGLDEQLADSDMASLIFEPGFSTAVEVTELAGRGVGMDVVRSEAASLGGRVEVASVAGSGAEFTIRLPLTLAVTQVVLLSSGGRTFAVPSVLVEQVQQLKAHALATAYNERSVQWQNQRVPMHYLSALLGQRDAVPLAQQYSPLLIMKNGTERVAIHVDDIVGNREVVVKNIGPQLARMPGVAGATVLGSGDIVLIINPVPLAQKWEAEQLRLPQLGHEMGAVADLQEHSPQLPAEPVQGLRTQHTVMVVDDSLTVRRVTQRLLAREGYQVILAKDGIDALEQLQSITPDVMLVDIEMPRMDGFDLTRNVRSDARTAHIPIIMITSRTADKHRNYARELGVNEYFGKPYREDDLLEAIVGFIGENR
ncbi:MULTISPECIES: Hpt domain-containing protein [unclassified Undibacterium]|uniref:Hpt domain-containing protein n=1 Tax=unclassified Undibacterium TaxID=2630295 RepID=UPI002AC9451E|nr:MULTISPECIES: Hpt domain-containing protein [unclassified Undibacterium]MEB0137904.1 Hpt domain-containing protein [Undibacterium sp. CCC2.1]MEB0172024.1 Hpt domain-containing protein [Undibacterium sp. CCC1.1]MEB0174912.1 Hpt domain-containing protein [Undibacterium sp. CCC3.4]MEB0214880.1 Hpt domain-containing protein [Undibacterium sp. 5I2]WPX45359.1 Hpt domain-containing protein [Undibacterium sp. CCC3.4]